MAYVAANGRLPVGEAKITSGGMLPAKYVIHTVGPVWSGGRLLQIRASVQLPFQISVPVFIIFQKKGLLQ